MVGTSAQELLAHRDAQLHVMRIYLNVMHGSCFHMFQPNNSLSTSSSNAGDILPRLHEGMPIWHAGSCWKPGCHQRQWFFQHGVWLPLSRWFDQCVATVIILSKSVLRPFFLHHGINNIHDRIESHELWYDHVKEASMEFAHVAW